jgi:phosphatidyl-myo-inositol dimannoside synthase
MVMNKKVLFLTLRVFSATGGIEKVCKVVSMALNELSQNLQVLSMYDNTTEVDKKYTGAAIFKGYNQQKLKFVWDAIFKGIKMDIVILSHINLLSIGYLIKLLSPKTKIVLYAHGIEVWGPLSGLRKKMLHRCDTIIAVSNFTKEKMMAQYGLANEKVCVINNCIDPYLPVISHKEKDELLKKRYNISGSDIVLLTLTRLSSKELYKGYDSVLIALTHLKNQFPNIKYLIVGKYDIAEKNRLDKIISDHSLQQYVVLSGYIPDEELAKHYCLADIYVMPSKKEGFGIVFIEAMHYGLPVIAGDKDGSVDALYNGKLGILIDPDDQEEINNAINNIILDRVKYLPDRNLLAEAFSFSNFKDKLSFVFKQF